MKIYISVINQIEKVLYIISHYQLEFLNQLDLPELNI